MSESKPAGRWGRRLGLVFFSLLFTLGMLEVAARLLHLGSGGFWEPNDLYGWQNIPGARGWESCYGDCEVLVEINSLGLRDYDYGYEKEAGVQRILFLGDSMTAAMQVPLDESFVKVLEHGLNDEVGGGGRLEAVGRGQPGDRRVARLGRELALVDGPGEVAGDALDAGGRPPEVRLVDRHVLADRRVDLGDAVAHQPGAGHEHPLDGHAASVGRGAARDARRTPMTTAPARATPAPTRNTAG